MDHRAAKDFFISYTQVDEPWAEWIAWHLEEAGYSLTVQAWDFGPGCNFVHEMQQASEQCERVIPVLSQAFVDAVYTQPEWMQAFVRDPTGEKRLIVPVRVAECELRGLFGPLATPCARALRQRGRTRKSSGGRCARCCWTASSRVGANRIARRPCRCPPQNLRRGPRPLRPRAAFRRWQGWLRSVPIASGCSTATVSWTSRSWRTLPTVPVSRWARSSYRSVCASATSVPVRWKRAVSMPSCARFRRRTTSTRSRSTN